MEDVSNQNQSMCLQMQILGSQGIFRGKILNKIEGLLFQFLMFLNHKLEKHIQLNKHWQVPCVISVDFTLCFNCHLMK